MVYFKEGKLREEFHKLDSRVRKIAYVLSTLMDALHGEKATVTSVYREDVHSPHHFYRAIDLRSRDIKPEACVYLEAILNVIFPYEKEAHQTVIYHDSGQGIHFHIQVKPEM